MAVIFSVTLKKKKKRTKMKYNPAALHRRQVKPLKKTLFLPAFKSM